MSSMGIVFWLTAVSLGGTADPNEEGDYVSRQAFESLKQEVEAMKAAQSKQETAPTSSETKTGFVDQKATAAWQAGQTDRLGDTKLLIAGDMNAGYVNQDHGDNTFFAESSPMLLWQLNERLFFEGGLDFDLSGPELDGEGSQTDVSIGAAYLSYLVNNHALAGLGYFPLPFTQYHNHFDAPWINKLPTDPLAYGDNGLAPDAGLGAFATGAFACHHSGWNYALWATNGPALMTEGDNAGMLSFDNYEDTNNGKAVGGRLGYLPIPWLEVGASFQYAQVAPKDMTEHVYSRLFGVDWNYVQVLDAIKGRLTVRGGWIWSDVSAATYTALPGSPRFSNNSNGGYAELAYRPTKVAEKWYRDFEFVGRYDRLDIPSHVPSGGTENQWTGGIDYWITPRTVVKAAYTWDNRDQGQDQNLFAVQLATGF